MSTTAAKTSKSLLLAAVCALTTLCAVPAQAGKPAPHRAAAGHHAEHSLDKARRAETIAHRTTRAVATPSPRALPGDAGLLEHLEVGR